MLRSPLAALLLASMWLAACGPTDDTPDAGNCADVTELCNFQDDDCDGEIDEDFPAYGTPCDGADSDSCNEGLYTCNTAGDGLACSDATTGTPERCNGEDDDCDGQIDEGFDLNAACDGTDADFCEDDVTVCNSTGDRVICANVTPDASEACNGVDDDCDGQIDEDFSIGAPCDGPDADLCKEGTYVCNGSGTAAICEETFEDAVERCDGADNDCDGTIDEGFANLGAPCDGADTDACQEGTVVCNSAGDGTVCSDPNDLNFEKCNGIDDDCDGVIDNGYGIGTPCDGPDADGCNEGTIQCISQSETTCTDDTGGNTEVCDETDNDCDGNTDEDLVCCGAGNALCQPEIGEDVTNCADCVVCGDGICSADFGETSTTCFPDCP